MYNTKSDRTNIPTALKAVCDVVFCLFSFLYLYFYQADVLCYGYHLLSDGRTYFDDLSATVVVTILLLILQKLSAYISRPSPACYTLSFLPSFLILTMLTSVEEGGSLKEGFSVWLWVLLVVLLLWYIVSICLRQINDDGKVNKGKGIFSFRVWTNILLLCVMMFLTGMFSNNNDMFHYRLHAERCIMDGRYDDALRSGVETMEPDSSLTMLRAYSLSCAGQMGDSLFAYPLCGGSKSLLPDGRTVRTMLIQQETISLHYKQKKYAADYHLASLLLDKRIDEFAKVVSRYYKLDASLPRHYREALVLYTHLRSNPLVVYHDAVMDVDYQDLLSLYRTTKNATKRRNLLRSTYGNTYWCYFFTTDVKQ